MLHLHFLQQMLYNAEGELLKPIVIHHGVISGYCEVNYSDVLDFRRTEGGAIDRTVVCAVWENVRR